jgi:hypothetical protein
MKHLTAIVCLFSVFTSKAQMCPCEFSKDKNAKVLRNEFGLNTFNLHEELINFYSENIQYIPAPLSGFTYKRHFNNYSLRAAYTYSHHTYKFAIDNAMNFNKNDGYAYNHDLRIGIEKTFNVSDLQYFAGVDLVYNSGIYNGISEGFGDFQPYYKLPYRFKTTYIGLAPIVGAKYRFSNRWSISLETGLQMVHYQTQATEAYDKENGIALMVQPIRSLGLNYHF